MKTIHSKKSIKADLSYARQGIAQIVDAMKNNDWNEVNSIAQELSALFSSIESYSLDNHEGILDFACKFQDEIDAIRAQQKEETR